MTRRGGPGALASSTRGNLALAAGFGGRLLPREFVVERFGHGGATRFGLADGADVGAIGRLWRRVELGCGPLTGIRAIADVAAMPLAAALGYRAGDARFDANRATFRLTKRDVADDGVADGLDRPVALLVAPWAHRSPAIWRDAVSAAHRHRADWCLIVAPPFVQIVDARAAWGREAVEFSWPKAAESEWLAACMARFAGADALAFTGPGSLRALLAEAARFQVNVGAELQRGVAASLDRLGALGIDRHESLAIVYRVLFLLFVEARDLIPWRHPLYEPAYSIGAMAARAVREPSAAGYWPGLAAVSRLLRAGCRTPRLVVPPFNGRLFARSAAPSLERRTRARGRRAADEDAAVAFALAHLSTRTALARDGGGRRAVAFRDLGVEELGSVYEQVLVPSDRKQTGTFYTPRALTEFVVRETLGPLVDGRSADELLSLRVLDPAMGSGAFLVAACRFLAAAYEQALLDEHRVLDHEVDEAMRAEFRRTIASRCVYGVDRNATAVELARLSLWLTALSAGKPLSFLDHRLRHGDAIVGIGPHLDVILQTPLARRGQPAAMPLFEAAALEAALEQDARAAAATLHRLSMEPDDDVLAVRRKESAFAALASGDAALAAWRAAADLWCASRFDPDGGVGPRELRAAVHALVHGDRTLPVRWLAVWRANSRRVAQAGHFFHWPLEFTDAFFRPDGTRHSDAGFDAVVGNPPWEMLRADHDAGGRAAAVTRFVRASGQYADAARGHLNLYLPFVERAAQLAKPGGRIGLVVPWGLCTDDGAASLRARLFERCHRTSITGFDNRLGIFPVHRGLRFAAVAATIGRPAAGRPAINVRSGITDLDVLTSSAGAVPFARLPVASIARIGGRTRRVPDIRDTGDVAFLERLTARWPRVGSDAGFGARFGRELNATDDRALFGGAGLPVLDGRHIAPYVVDAAASTRAIGERAAAAALPDRAFDRPRLAYRDVSAVGNRHALIAAVLPHGVVTTHTLFCLKTPLPIAQQHYLCACFNSAVLNRVARLLMGSHLTTSLVEDLPVPPWTGSVRQRRIAALARRAAARGLRPGDSVALATLVAREFGEPA
jgi:hypothetical protein